MKRCLLAVGSGLLLAGAWAEPAAAQGLVLGKDSRPLPAARARALLVFQELGSLENRGRADDNRQDLLVELELAAPAPEGAVWVLSAPRGATAKPGSAAVLDEVAAFWRAERGPADTVGKSPLAAPPPAWAPSASKPAPAAVSGPMDLAALEQALRARGVALPADARVTAGDEAAGGWCFFLADVPAGAERLAAHLRFNSVVARFPGALGAGSSIGPVGRIGPMGLPPLELMVLHSHFINVDDNAVNSLQACVGLGRVYQDSGTLQEGGQLWARPAESRPGPVREAAGKLRASAEFMAAAAPGGHLFLTVVTGSPAAAGRPRLDFYIYSHYPSGMDPLRPRSSLLWLAAVCAGLLVMAVWLLKRKGFAE